MRYILFLLILIPAADIGLLLFSGKTIGVLPTIACIILTGVIGAYLAKREGLQTIRKAQQELRSGKIPGEAVIDGICIIIGGTLLITPGFITDLVGFLMLLPLTRKPFKWALKKFFRKWTNPKKIKIIK